MLAIRNKILPSLRSWLWLALLILPLLHVLVMLFYFQHPLTPNRIIPVATPYIVMAVLTIFELVIVGLVLFYGISLQRFIIPLNHFKNSANQLGIDVKSAPIEIYGPEVVRETADAMNKMQERILELLNNRTKMLAAISHDIRTPITRIKLRVQFMDDAVMAQKIITDLDEMEIMLESVLAFAREDKLQGKMAIFDLNSLLVSVCDDFIDQGKMLTLHLPEARVPFLGNRLAIKRVFMNIIQNALKYGNQAWVYFNCEDDKIIVTVKDDGPGIPPQDLEKVFQAYYRADNLTASSPGTGLGLTIVYEIMRAHRGSIHLKNNDPDCGLHVTLIFPHYKRQTAL